MVRVSEWFLGINVSKLELYDYWKIEKDIKTFNAGYAYYKEILNVYNNR